MPPALKFLHASQTRPMSSLNDMFEILLIHSDNAIWSTFRKQTRQESDSTWPMSRYFCVMLVEPGVDSHIDVFWAFAAGAVDGLKQLTEIAKIERHRSWQKARGTRCDME
jgi:hypothetical protein